VAHIISEPDKGIYDAMNKGIRMATGDIVGTLNSDDFFTKDDIIQKIVNQFTPETDAVFGDIVFVDPGHLNKVVRYYSASKWSPQKFAKGYMPPHPSFYLKKQYYDQYGLYKTDYQIASDYELLIRMLYTHKLNYVYLETPMVTMRTGGVSTKNIKSRYILNKEIVRACRENNIQTSMLKLAAKYPIKALEYFRPDSKVN
jgi:glycosyltransferase involved in cell wall biosynthesis